MCVNALDPPGGGNKFLCPLGKMSKKPFSRARCPSLELMYSTAFGASVVFFLFCPDFQKDWNDDKRTYDTEQDEINNHYTGREFLFFKNYHVAMAV